jgi:hypothetical protein
MSNYKIYSNELIPGIGLKISDKFILIAIEQPKFILFDNSKDTVYICNYSFKIFKKHTLLIKICIKKQFI